MAIKNVEVVNTASKYIVKSTGKLGETDQILVDAEELIEGTDGSTVSLIECYYVIEGTGTLTISADSETKPLSFTNSGKYGLMPGQLKFGNDKQFKVTSDFSVRKYTLVTEFRRN